MARAALVQALPGARAFLWPAAALYLGLAAAVLAALARTDRAAALGLAWSVGTFLPASNVLFPVRRGPACTGELSV